VSTNCSDRDPKPLERVSFTTNCSDRDPKPLDPVSFTTSAGAEIGGRPQDPGFHQRPASKAEALAVANLCYYHPVRMERTTMSSSLCPTPNRSDCYPKPLEEILRQSLERSFALRIPSSSRLLFTREYLESGERSSLESKERSEVGGAE
jgi:hypothetical protein